MIKINQKRFESTIKFALEKNDLNLLNNENEAINILAAKNEIYVILDPEEDIFSELKSVLQLVIEKLQRNLNIDFDSLKNIYKLDTKQLFSNLYSALAFVGFAMENHKQEKIKQFEFNIISDEELSKFETDEKAKAKFVNYARELQDTPPNIGTATYYADKIKTDAKQINGLKVSVFGRKQAAELGMNLFLSVNAGSSVEGQVVVVEYCSDPSIKKTALVGKGICFDSGGYNLKPAQHMAGMKFDMSGAASAIATVMALATVEAKANVVAVGMFTDNRIGHTATLPDSVVVGMNKKTVVIEDTDAEGRLVLADGLTYAAQVLKADQLIDIATLTGTVVYALGQTTGVFSHNDEMVENILKVSKSTNEPIWRLPILPRHLKQIQKDARGYADLSSCAKVSGEDCSYAAAFLNEFTEGVPYLHIDVAGSADIENKGQGVMVKTLFEMLKQ